jgi:hypothetical protein
MEVLQPCGGPIDDFTISSNMYSCNNLLFDGQITTGALNYEECPCRGDNFRDSRIDRRRLVIGRSSLWLAQLLPSDLRSV